MQFKFVSALLLLAFIGFGLKAQEPDHKIKFEKTSHDFGTLTQGDPCQFTFKLTNTSDAPVKLTNVKASCGCTTPKWSREPIAPGETSEIPVKYDSNRLGNFNKSIRVTYEGSAQPIVLFIKGKINPKEGANPVPTPVKTPLVEAPPKPAINYGIVRGGISFEKVIENLRSITSNDSKTVAYRFKNTSTSPIKINEAKTQSDPGISVKFADADLAPGEESSFEVTVDGKKMKADNVADGYFSKRVTFYTDEPTSNEKIVTLNGSFAKIYTEEEKAAAPKLVFEKESIDGGKLIEGEKFVVDYIFTNEGKTDLELTSVKASCGCTTPFWPKGEKIGPGESGKITASFNSKGRLGRQAKSITVKSNSLESPTKVLKFSVEVVKDPFHAGSMMGGSQ